MKKTHQGLPAQGWKKSLLSLAVGAALCTPVTVMAVQFELADGEVTGALDTTLSYGALWRVTGKDSRLLARAKGGDRNSANYDNGNAGYDRGDLVSSIFRVSNDLDVNYKNFGAFVRVSSFYDHAIQNKDFDPLLADQKVIRSRLGHDYEIYDAYVRGKFNMLDRNVGVRLGKQVISLGESTFIPNGLNALNPVDVGKLRTPGAELKEAFLPTQMLQVTFDVTDNISVELINKFQFRESRPEPNGSYFSTNDFLSPGGTKVLLQAGGANEASPVRISRGRDKTAKDTGQYAVALRMLSPELNNTEFGLYAMNYHSSAPSIAGRTGAVAGPFPGGMPTTATYNAEYVEDIRLYGISFNTLGPLGVALQGEYSYRPNQPLNLVANNTLNALLAQNGSSFNTGIGAIGPNAEVVGYKKVKMHQFQMTATQTLGRYLGASQIIALGEAGYTYLDLPKGIDFNGTGVDFTTPLLTNGLNTNGVQVISSDRGILTKNSYGYRALLRATYNNAIGAINLSPRVAFQHDLRGTSPTFTHNTQSVTVGVTAEYQNNISADISYTNFFAGETIGATNNVSAFKSTNQALADRDFIAATVSYAF
ncbi:MAG: DUF1302 domain-containing protein [Pseudomonadota bacterium]